jgi:hypothetical protein
LICSHSILEVAENSEDVHPRTKSSGLETTSVDGRDSLAASGQGILSGGCRECEGREGGNTEDEERLERRHFEERLKASW